MATRLVTASAAVMLALVPIAAMAEQAKTPVAPLMLDLTSRPVESYESAFNERMRGSGPAPRRSATEGKVLADGSVQYGEGNGSVIVTLRNPCPEGSGHYDDFPKPLPGRRPRN
jgi:hypothetical protein